jgi:hypothetical protein
MLARAGGVGYIHEPLNPQLGVEGVDRWFPYLRPGQAHETRYLRIVQGILSGTAAWKPRDGGGPSPSRRLARALLGSGDRLRWLFSTRWPGYRRLLWKDPFACLASEYLHRRLGMEVVMLVRHPAAFACSLARLDWSLGFGVLRRQPALMEDYLAPLLEGEDVTKMDIMEEAAVFWRCLYTVMADYADRNPDIMVVRHEDLSEDPEGEFRRLFGRLGLRMTPSILRRIRRQTSASNRAFARSGEVHRTSRDSRALAWAWRNRLEEDRKAMIRRRTEPLVSRFYPEDAW